MSADRRPLLIFLAALALAGAIGWWLHLRLRAAGLGAPAATTTPRGEHAPTGPPVPSPAALTVAAPRLPGHPGKTDGDSVYDICGKGELRYAPGTPDRAYDQLASIEKDVMQRWQQALLQSHVPRARAAGLVLKIWQRHFTAQDTQTPKAPDPELKILTQLATGNADPAVYAIALSQCSVSAYKVADGCGSLSVNTLTELDPDNAVAWLLRAAQARRQQDKAVEDWAMEHAARAGRSDLYVPSLYEFAQADAPADATALDRKYLFAELTGPGAGVSYSIDDSPTLGLPLQQASAFCSTQAEQEAATQDRCARLADVLTAHAGTLLEYASGKAIGERSGWSESRIRQAEDVFEAAQRVSAEPQQSWSCEAVQRFDGYLKEWLQLGEMGAARAQVERSGKMTSELASEQRTKIQKHSGGMESEEPMDAVRPTRSAASAP